VLLALPDIFQHWRTLTLSLSKMKTAGKKITYTKKPTKISKFEIFILNPDLQRQSWYRKTMETYGIGSRFSIPYRIKTGYTDSEQNRTLY
jgi:hypothetical protein